jgi:hypothetical protein
VTTTFRIDLPVDFNAVDETGLPWTYLDEAVDQTMILPGAHVVAGAGTVRAVVRIVDVSSDGIVHVCDIPGSVESNAYLLDCRSVGYVEPEGPGGSPPR